MNTHSNGGTQNRSIGNAIENLKLDEVNVINGDV
jgi:hypothetical protein